MSRLWKLALWSGRFALRLVLAAAALDSSARAVVVTTPLAPGGVQYNPALNPPYAFFTPSYTNGPLPPAYHTLIKSTNFPYNYNGQKDGSFQGFVTSNIWANDAGQLAFTYVFNNQNPASGSPLTDIVRATLNDPSDPWLYGALDSMQNPIPVPFAITGVGADGLGHSTAINGLFGGWSNGNPFSVQRDGTDASVSINFNPLNSGTQLNSVTSDQSALIWVTTNATHADVTNVGLSDNGHVGVAQAYAPNIKGTIPEPSTLVLLALGGLGCSVMAYRRRRSR